MFEYIFTEPYTNYLHYILILTSLGFIFPVFFRTVPIWMEYGLFFTACISSSFWSDPYLHMDTILHRLDGFFARCMIIAVFIWGVIYSENLSIFIFMTVVMMGFFILSNRESIKGWCCSQHIIYHIIAHTVAIGAVFYM